MFIRVKDKEYEIYLSSNGVCKAEDEGVSFMSIDISKVSYKTLIVLMYGCLYEKNNLTLRDVGNLIDEFLEDENNSLNDLAGIMKEEIKRWTGKFKKK
jgi:hypothetical protein